MPHYRFTAVDSHGTLHDGGIDAATETDARNKLASNGLAVRTVEPAPGVGPDAPEPAPRRPAPRAPAADDRSSAGRFRAEPADRPAPPRRGRLPLVLSALALLVSLGTAGYVLLRDPFSNRLGKYDFRTPEAAHQSVVRMAANADVLAMRELEQKLQSKHVRERLNTMQVSRTRPFRDKAVLFVEWERDGTRQREVVIYERDPDTGFWKPNHSARSEIEQSDRQLAREIAQWAPPQFPHVGGFGPGVMPGDDPDE